MDTGPKLMVSAMICLKSDSSSTVEIRRGMPILSDEGQEIGQVAAVIMDRVGCKVTHILLSRLPEMYGYWMVPLEMINRVRNEDIQLRISEESAKSLPLWHPSE